MYTVTRRVDRRSHDRAAGAGAAATLAKAMAVVPRVELARGDQSLQPRDYLGHGRPLGLVLLPAVGDDALQCSRPCGRQRLPKATRHLRRSLRLWQDAMCITNPGSLLLGHCRERTL